MLKRSAKFLLAIVFYYSGILAFYSFFRRTLLSKGNFAVLMYHRILDEADPEIDDVQPGLYVSRQVFEKQISFLSKNYNVISGQELIESLIKRRSLPPKTVVITFDDGWRDNYLNAFPILKKRRIQATIFLTVDFIGTGRLFWFQEISSLFAKLDSGQLATILAKTLNENRASKSARELPASEIDFIVSNRDLFIEKMKSLDTELVYIIINELKKAIKVASDDSSSQRLMLDWEEVLGMADCIEFGSHGLSHNLLTMLDSSQVDIELKRSKEIIETKLGKPISTFSYPNGNMNNEIKQAVENAGYQGAFIVGHRENSGKEMDRFAIDRVGIHNGVLIGISGKFSKAMFSFHLQRSL